MCRGRVLSHKKGASRGLLVFSRDSSSHRETTVIRKRLCLGPKCLRQLVISRELKPQEQYSILQGHVASRALISCLISSFCSLISFLVHFSIVKRSLVSGSGYFSYHEGRSLIVNPHTGIPAFKPVSSKFGKVETKNILAHRYTNIFCFP